MCPFLSNTQVHTYSKERLQKGKRGDSKEREKEKKKKKKKKRNGFEPKENKDYEKTPPKALCRRKTDATGDCVGAKNSTEPRSASL